MTISLLSLLILPLINLIHLLSEKLGSFGSDVEDGVVDSGHLSHLDAEAFIGLSRCQFVSVFQLVCRGIVIVSHVVQGKLVCILESLELVHDHVIVRGEQSSATNFINNVLNDGLCNCLTVESSGTAAKLVNYHKRIRSRLVQYRLSLLEFDVESALIFQNSVTSSDSRENSINHGQFKFVGWYEATYLGKYCGNTCGSKLGALASHVRSRNQKEVSFINSIIKSHLAVVCCKGFSIT